MLLRIYILQLALLVQVLLAPSYGQTCDGTGSYKGYKIVRVLFPHSDTDETLTPNKSMSQLDSRKNAERICCLVLATYFLKITQGEQGKVCVQFGNSKKYGFQVKVDEYTALNMDTAFQLAFSSESDVNVFVQGKPDAKVSEETSYIKTIDSQVVAFPMLSVVIRLHKGEISSIYWDNGCWDSNEKCYKNDKQDNMYKDTTNCKVGSGQSTYCDPTVYLSWEGTDADGHYCQSSNMRISRFARYSVSSLYRSYSDKFS